MKFVKCIVAVVCISVLTFSAVGCGKAKEAEKVNA